MLGVLQHIIIILYAALHIEFSTSCSGSTLCVCGTQLHTHAHNTGSLQFQFLLVGLYYFRGSKCFFTN